MKINFRVDDQSQRLLDDKIDATAKINLKDIANKDYQDGNFERAIEGYTFALYACEEIEDIAFILSNLAQVALQLNQFHTTIATATACLKLGIENPGKKAAHRLTTAFMRMGESSLVTTLLEEEEKKIGCDKKDNTFRQ